jgi:hypothetical protein
MLGVPLGSITFNSEFVAKKLLGRLDKTLGQLGEWSDAQSAFFLLRVSFGIVRATHFMRTTPFEHWFEVGSQFDRQIRGIAESILGFPFPPNAYTQATLTPTLGGLGLRRTVDHANAAFAASFHESQSTAKEVWLEPPNLQWSGNQKSASFKIDSAIRGKLIEQTKGRRECKRLLRIAEPHAGAFVTALPSSVDGMDAVMKPQQYRTAVAYRLGVPVLPHDGVPCPLCKQPMDVCMEIMHLAAQGMEASS